MVPPVVSRPPAATSAACHTRDYDVEEANNSADDRLQDCTDAVDYGHQTGTDGAEDRFDTRDDGTHFEAVLVER